MQKPVALYLWLYAKYAHPYDKIFDSHLGSGSSRIAAYDKRKQEKQDETLVKMTERVVKLEGDSARTNKRLEILESHDYGGSK